VSIIYNEFKNLCDNVIIDEKIGQLSLEGYYEFFGLKHKGSMTLSMINTLLTEKMQGIEVDSQDKGISKKQLDFLIEELILRHICFAEEIDPYWCIITTFRMHLNNKHQYMLPIETSNEKWIIAIKYSKYYIEINERDIEKRLFSISNDVILSKKHVDRANSIIKIRDIGCDLVIDDEVEISNFEEGIKNLESMIEQIGGLKVIFETFNRIHHRYSKRFHRYLLGVNVSYDPSKIQPQLPVGFLLNLSLKHVSKTPKVTDKSEAISVTRKIMDYATSLITAKYDLQVYSMFENMFINGDNIIDKFQNIALYDSLYSIPQCGMPSFFEIMTSLICNISKDKQAEIEQAIGLSICDYIAICKSIVSLSKGNCPVFFTANQLIQHAKISPEQVSKALCILSWSDPINSQYTTPDNYSDIDFWKKPLIHLADERYLLINKSWCIGSFYEAIAVQSRSIDKPKQSSFDNQIGKALEQTAKSMLTSHNISYRCGKYTDPSDKSNGECDIIIESATAIVIIEIKKKVFTHKAKSGIDINIFIDLLDSVIAAIVQASKVELILLKQGFIELDSNGIVSRIDYNGRVIEKIALTHLEYGGFQDRMIIRNLFNTLRSTSLGTNSTNQSDINKFKVLEKKRLQWVSQLAEIQKITDRDIESMLFSNWFLSIFHLYELVIRANSNDEFYASLKQTKYVTFSTLDFYTEIEQVIKSKDID